jgi:hypothetical protein
MPGAPRHDSTGLAVSPGSRSIALAQWLFPRDGRKTMIVALARKTLIALRRLVTTVTTGEIAGGVILRPTLGMLAK